MPILLVLLFVLCSIGVPTSAEASTITTGAVPKACLDVPGGVGAVWKQLQISDCNGSASQEFTLQNGEIHFGSLCVDAGSINGTIGNPIVLWSCHGGANQKWHVTQSGQIQGINGRCFEIGGAGKGPGAKVILGNCRDSSSLQWAVNDAPAVRVPANECTVKDVQPSPQTGITTWSPDGTRFLVNKEDASGIAQVYVGKTGSSDLRCLTCSDAPNGPGANKFKMMAMWHPSGKWIVLAAEQGKYDKPWFANKALIKGWLQSGLWLDMYATTPDGSVWYKLQDFGPSNRAKARGYTGPAFTPDGKKGVWAQIVDGNIFKYGFGKWELIMGDFQEVNGVPTFTNLRNITPHDTFWVEPGNFSPNGRDLVLTADTGFRDHAFGASGQDQYVLDVFTGAIKNLTNTPTIWDEHGLFSPDGEKILFMSSFPYPDHSTILSLKTEFMLMNKDGSNLQRLTHFYEPGFPEYVKAGAMAADAQWSPDGTWLSARTLQFPDVQPWKISFQGHCGANSRQRH